MVASLTPEYLPDYLKDPTRWKSLYAVSEIKFGYLKDYFHEPSI
uniref:Uncharacterized protein n=1 Tax=Candidatus Kentrum sp. MB TaxID=2138164 RepID=A0A451BD56_9GAMM|nr:MAG: hypothetical protein BECKMB1821G_GA0114241_11036 [Candidatus Kentron sp. MB]VFK35086.1 MAG: hypothetical protein BECKMB1821I_GA0114274_10996 [Candidatus Kentron sp. MB]VFK76217.1 MAG: hypothetical protein BECKMB1821H_GA0114242_104621 [Candidatus Kentron sp. MB]